MLKLILTTTALVFPRPDARFLFSSAFIVDTFDGAASALANPVFVVHHVFDVGVALVDSARHILVAHLAYALLEECLDVAVVELAHLLHLAAVATLG